MILTMTLTIPALAVDYAVNGADPGNFGNPTSIEPVASYGGEPTDDDNINRSKDAAYAPPAFGSATADYPNTAEYLTPGRVESTQGNGSQISVSSVSYDSSESIVMPPSSTVSTITTTTNTSTYIPFTMPTSMYCSDGSIGTLSIPALDISARVYETESLESLAKGIGHFNSTSCWDGNVAFAAHNRGTTNYFGKIHTLSDGDKIIYTQYGTRTYEVYSITKIKETDFSYLGRTTDNQVTLITCVAGQSEYRWCVRAVLVS